ncbi:uncharacterized protein PHACADRAFT_181775 [Phanerochaete carnosa HHB-10118-sp]|uniref:F-box domain-containing protein n=1 Tax=Phanerochaete carnosa (strain HHB-10118-sp) TaxID=650164 RepID=K5W7C8_PHACS|nr:uncharacterized protein PHACADRAFT_181775 [Phanerochaete carnosa HHB-10118-sp]EKM59828.1 hypothetical protein PHACADRAFT_181775 [Phanerochaete carnosa HHB-10118-sp]
MTICWVCKRWRAIALDTPVLWTNIRVNEFVEPTEAYLERSQNTQLFVSGSLNFHLAGGNNRHTAAPDTWALVLKHSDRIEAMSVDYKSGLYKDLVPTMNTEHFKLPQLRRLRLQFVHVSPNDKTRQSVFVPHRFEVDYHASLLEELEIIQLPFTLTSTLLTVGLRKLILCGIEWDRYHRPWDILLGTLKRLPCIEEFRLLEDLPELPMGNFSLAGQDEKLEEQLSQLLLAAPVDLPKLRLLEVASSSCEDAGQVGLLMSNLTLPARAAISITLCGTCGFTYQEVFLIGSILATTFSVPAAGATPRLPLRTLCLQRAESELAYGGAPRITGWSEPLSPEKLPPGTLTSSPSPTLSLGVADQGRSVDILDTLKLLPLGSLEYLAVHQFLPFFVDYLLAFAHARNLRVLSASGRACHWLIFSLTPPGTSGALSLDFR